jgi:asparagine synthetase B (glutamine-hydrolysing)
VSTNSRRPDEGAPGANLDRPWSPRSLPQPPPTLARPSIQAIQSVLLFGGLPSHLGPFREEGSPTRANGAIAAEAEVSRDRDLCVAAGVFPKQEARRRLERALAAYDKRPVVLFSGGVDSSLIAALLRASGRDDTRLVHLSFGQNDPETDAARQIASVLDLELIELRSTGSGTACLNQPGSTYPVPFGDISTAPTFELMEGVAQIVGTTPSVVIDGTGADGAFGLGAKIRSFERVARLPAMTTRLPSRAYTAGIWRVGGSLEYRSRVARRIAELPVPLAIVAQNALFDHWYATPDLPQLTRESLRSAELIGGKDPVARAVFMDLSLTCARIFAQKTLGPARAHGLDVVYPFLDSGLASLGIAGSAYAGDSAPKAWMKELLSTFIPPELVHREKSGFIDPSMSMFSSDEFRGALRDATDRHGVAAELLHTKVWSRWLGRQTIATLPHGHKNLLWALAFTDRWYRTYSTTSESLAQSAMTD